MRHRCWSSRVWCNWCGSSCWRYYWRCRCSGRCPTVDSLHAAERCLVKYLAYSSVDLLVGVCGLGIENTYPAKQHGTTPWAQHDFPTQQCPTHSVLPAGQIDDSCWEYMWRSTVVFPTSLSARGIRKYSEAGLLSGGVGLALLRVKPVNKKKNIPATSCIAGGNPLEASLSMH